MICRDFENEFELFVLGELAPARAQTLREHLSGCPACETRRAEAETLLEHLDQKLKGLPPSPGLAARIGQAVLAESAPPRLSKPAVWRAPLLAAAAVILVAVLVVLMVGEPPPHAIALENARIRPGPDARYTILGPRRVRLEAGDIACSVDPSSEPFTVETAAALATATGTDFVVSVRGIKGGPMKGARLATAVFIMAGTVQLSNLLGTASGRRGEQLYAEENGAPTRQVEDLQAKFGDAWEAVPTSQKPSVPAYTLPLDPKAVENLEDVARKTGMAADEPLLLRNGFVVVGLPGLPGVDGPIAKDDIAAVYNGLKKAELPAFVTTDTLLHLFHVQFDEALKDIEEREFAGDIAAIAEMLVKRLGEETAAAEDPVVKEAFRKAWAYASVGLKAMKPEFAPDAAVSADVELVMEKIGKHEGFWPEPDAAHEQWPLFRYAEDFSQYVPRGHYTRSEVLKRYFTGMMWFGRMSFILKGGDPHGPWDNQPNLVSAAEAKLQTLAAAAMTRLLTGEKLADGRSAREVWERMYAVTAFFVGLADDLGLSQYGAAIGRVLEATGKIADLADPAKFQALRVELAKFRGPAIYGGTGGQGGVDLGIDPEALNTILGKTTGFRLMGQRFIPDSYMFGKLVYPAVGRPTNGRTDMFTFVESDGGPIRGFPRGLDVMAVMGSARARAILSKLGDDAYGTNDTGKDVKYQAAFDRLRKEFAGMSERDWNRNLYWSWLYALQSLTAPYGEGYPTFMTTEAWHDKSLTTALASWAQLRHDTILYAKQSYTPAPKGAPPREPKVVPGFVEPVPQFYARMLAMTRMTLKGLGGMKALNPQAEERLKGLETILARLLTIAEQELADKPLAKEDVAFVRDFGDALSGIRVRYPEIEKELKEAEKRNDWNRAGEIRRSLDPHRAMMTTLVADVHTDQSTKTVLEEGTGLVELAIVCVRQPDGRLTLAAGPVLSYYEFKHPMMDRLTDEKWVEMLKSGKAPAAPEWVGSYRNVK